MPYTVWGTFDVFRQNTVDLDSEETKKARASRDYLFGQLKNLARDDSEFPMTTSYYHSFGSFARRTKIRPLNDVDVMIMFNGRDTIAAQSSGDPYTYYLKIGNPSSPLALFPDDYGYVNSTKILYKIKRSLTSVSNYKKADLKKNMQAVILNLVSYPWSFDIVPAVPIGASSTVEYYLIPNGNGDWIRTDPRTDADNITRLNKQHGGEFLPTVRLLKYWNRRTHKPRLGSYYFETLTLKVFDYAPRITDFPTAMKYFFDHCPTHLWSSCPDPKGLGDNLDSGVSRDTKEKVSQAMTKAADYGGYALKYEKQSNDEEAIYWWRQVFGPNLPDYG